MMDTIGRTAVALAMSQPVGQDDLALKAKLSGFLAYRGQVGSMQLEKVVAAIETAARRQGLVSGTYREEHALYHSIIDALTGICRGQLVMGHVMRTVGLAFSIVRGPKAVGESGEGEWIAVALYGTIGAPIRGHEHEAMGLGINHL